MLKLAHIKKNEKMMKRKQLVAHGRKLFKLDSNRKMAAVMGCGEPFLSQIKYGRSYLPAKYIPALVEEYGDKGITEDYLFRMTKGGGL